MKRTTVRMEGNTERHAHEMNEHLQMAQQMQRMTDENAISHWYGKQMEGLRRSNEAVRLKENEFMLRCSELVEKSRIERSASERNADAHLRHEISEEHMRQKTALELASRRSTTPPPLLWRWHSSANELPA